MKEYKSMRVYPASKEVFDELVRGSKEKSMVLFDKMVRYFSKEKLSIMEKGFEDKKKGVQLEGNLTKQFNRMLGFMRTQEREHILPAIERSNALLEEVRVYLNASEEKVRQEVGKPTDRLAQIERSGKLRYVKEKVLEVLVRLKEKKNVFSKMSLELEGMDRFEIEKLIKLIKEID